jgi:hypothetical protein
MTDFNIRETVKQIVLANEDDDIQAMAAVVINSNGEPELYISMAQENGYRIISGLELLKFNIIKQMLNDAARPLRGRE